MSNIRGLYDDKDDDDSNDRDDSNNRYVGGIGSQGGGSGLAVEPNFDDANSNNAESGGGVLPSIFNLAEQAGPGDDDESGGGGGAPTRRTITMYRDGFVVDDGPYRRLDDPANAPFLQYLARGQTPRELMTGDGNNGNITVGLIDKRKEDYVEPFRTFSGAGNSLGAAPATSVGGSDGGNGILDPSSLPAPEEDSDGATVTSIAVRMLDGKRKVIKIALGASIEQLAARAVQASNTTIATPFRIVTGFPPKPLVDVAQSVGDAGLKGAQVQLQKA